jgi:esterase/lipase
MSYICDKIIKWLQYLDQTFNQPNIQIFVFIIICVFLCVTVIKKLFIRICDSFIFKPIELDANLYKKWINHPNVIHNKIDTNDGKMIEGFFYNKHKIPSYQDDLICLYSHGNSGWIGSVLETDVEIITDRGISVFVYDYQGYGNSTGHASDHGCMKNILEVYDYLLRQGVEPENIILFGHSLGGCISTYLMNHLIQRSSRTNESYPKHIILQNPFQNIQRICSEMVPILGHYVVSDLQTDRFINNMDRCIGSKSRCKNNTLIAVLIIHCIDDELINHQHSVDLLNSIQYMDKQLISVFGTHDKPIYTKEIVDYLDRLCDLYKKSRSSHD